MAASSSSASLVGDSSQELQRKVRNHEVAIAELRNLSSSRSVYQKCGNIFFLKDVKQAMASEEEKLDLVKAQQLQTNRSYM